VAIVAAAAITAGAAIFSANQSGKASAAASQAQLEAARLQTLVARELHDHWKAYYQACDAAFVQEICAIPVYVPQYETVAARARLTVLGEFGRARQQITRCQDIFCVGTFVQNCNFLSGIEAQALADAVNFGYRREENLKIQLDQMRLDNIHRTLMGGRNLLDQSGSASRIAGSISSNVGAQAGKAASGWLQFAGFLRSPEGQKAITSGVDAVSSFFRPTANTPAAGEGAFSDPAVADPGYGAAPGSGGFATGGGQSEAGPSAIPSSAPNATVQDYGGDWSAL
jgi:hypothetical protein